MRVLELAAAGRGAGDAAAGYETGAEDGEGDEEDEEEEEDGEGGNGGEEGSTLCGFFPKMVKLSSRKVLSI
jgi:ribosomal protein L12E/L44/L45/RPP1/RPP2